MATIDWANDVSGSFEDAADWTGGVVPGSSDSAVLAADGGAAYTVTASSNESVYDIQLAANATLVADGVSFTLAHGTGSGANDGTISVSGGAQVDVAGTINNVGTIEVSTTGFTDSVIRSLSGVTLTGDGDVNMAVNTVLVGDIDNVNNNISGYIDVVTDTRFTNGPSGIVDVTLASGAIFPVHLTAGHLDNQGLIETTASGSLDIEDMRVDNIGGVFSAANGTNINFKLGDTLSGGTFESAGTGVIYAGAAKGGNLLVTFDGSTSTIHNEAAVVVQDANRLVLKGAIDNSGSLSVESTVSTSAPDGDRTYLFVDSAGATLSGAGTVTLSDAAHNELAANGAGAVLTNVDNTIEGAGKIGGGSLGLTNEAAGVVNANGSVALTIDTTGAVVNDGLFESTGAGGLLIRSTTIDDTGGGTLSAAAGSKMLLDDADVEGGTISGAGRVMFADKSNVLDGTSATVDLAMALTVVDAGAVLTGEGTIDSSGVVKVQGGATLLGALDSTGVLQTAGGNMTVKGAVTGDGHAVIDGGRLAFDAAFNEDVRFAAAGGELVLGDSRHYDATLSGFSASGDTRLYLGDIGFAGSGEATFSGAKSGGVLTVVGTDGTAHINLAGDYLGVTFTASSADGGAASVIRASTSASSAAPAAPAHASEVGGPTSHTPPAAATPAWTLGDYPANAFPSDHAAGSLLIGEGLGGVMHPPVATLGDWLFH